jgi:hypothetical protein
MTMTSGQLPTITNTPRDPAAISAMGVFGHRKLAEALNAEGIPLWTTEMEKSAFITADSSDRAQLLLKALMAFDAARGGGAPPQAQPMPQMMQQPLITGGAVQEPPREPSNTGKKNKTNGTGATAVVDLKPVTDRLDAIGGMNRTEFENIKREVLALQQMVGVQYKIMQVLLGILANFGQEVLKAPAQAILEDSVTTGAEALTLLEGLGKAKGQ